MNKKTLVTLALIIIGVLGVVTLGYALLTSNMLTLTPQVTSILLEADTILCEDTRVTNKLLTLLCEKAHIEKPHKKYWWR